jgi:tyrosyl-tRNA synthetase
MMDIEKQTELLLRGTLFADEVEGWEAGAGSLAEAQGVPAPEASGTEAAGTEASGHGVAAPASGGRSLRKQMTDELRERLKEGRPLRVYLGVDPTATSLHIGHFVPVQKLRVFQQLGHQVIFLIGDYTALIGDPTGQKTERKRFTHEQVLEMASGYQRQAFQLLDPAKTEVRFNGEWLAKLSFAQIVELAAIFPLRWVVSRRDFRDRLDRGESLRLHETLYCLMQGYDAHALNCDVQVGAYDQHMNMLAGRWIQEHFGAKPHIIVTNPLLSGTDGRKMSKSYGNSINLLDSPDDIYGKSMRISDDLISNFIDLATDFPLEQSEALKARLKEHGVNPMEVKKEVAANLVRQYCGAEAVQPAADHFRSLVQNKEVPPEVPEVRLPDDLRGRAIPWTDLLVALRCDGEKLAANKSEVRRLMTQGGFYVEQNPVKDPTALYNPAPVTLVRLGKRRYFRILG